MDQLIEIVTYPALLSVAAKRFTDIIKRLVLSKYSVNGAVYQLVAAGFGSFVALIDNQQFACIEVGRYVQVLLIGLAVSGGSGGLEQHPLCPAGIFQVSQRVCNSF